MAFRFVASLRPAGLLAAGDGWAVSRLGEPIFIDVALSLLPAVTAPVWNPNLARVGAAVNAIVRDERSVVQEWAAPRSSSVAVTFAALPGLRGGATITLQGTPPAAGRFTVEVSAFVSGFFASTGERGVQDQPLQITQPPRLSAPLIIGAGAATPDTTAKLEQTYSWPQAAHLAMHHGAKIRRATWRDRYLTFRRGLWMRVPFDPVTKVESAGDTVRQSEFLAGDFRGLDWVAHAAVPDLAIAAALTISTRYP